ncbi:MAG: hypothetical protein GY850_30385, partial [bacterium]|nr:hypothetical protein [bacterium]
MLTVLRVADEPIYILPCKDILGATEELLDPPPLPPEYDGGGEEAGDGVGVGVGVGGISSTESQASP